ncbi:MAG: ATP-binding protein [Muribaculaceae bacterium]|nr:ATP-binding protein [Muribaculaceae bacterium]
MNTIADEIKYPVGLQSFPDIRERGFLYIDKTQYIYNLIKQKGYYFLSRPRRFGKSLLISTIEAYYTGRRDLFKGLALDSLTENWTEHPVLHLDLNSREYYDRGALEAELNAHLERWEMIYECPKPDRRPEERFANVIRKACEKTGKKVVILIDEYDKPLLNTVNDDELSDSLRSMLKAFYGNLKSMDRYIEFGFLTGVARFSKVSIFSDLNNLRDISFEEQYAGICGITSEELDSYFSAGISKLSEKEGMTPQETRETLRLNYDGYHFADISPDIYNPFSLMNVFAKLRLGSYRFEWGTPSHLVQLIKREKWLLRDLAPIEIEANILESAGLMSPDPIPTLYQTGYLTIKDFDRVFRTYTLDYPNREVRDGFISFLVPYYIKPSGQPGQFSIKHFVTALTSGDVDGFMRLLESMLAGVPYSEKGSAEAHFQNASYILFTLMGQYVRIEDRTSDGRIDLTVETPLYIYIFEFKIDSIPEEAMKQIHEKKYWLKHIHSGKEIILIGAAFNTSTRRLNGYLVEKLS